MYVSDKHAWGNDGGAAWCVLGVCHGEQGMQIRLDALTRAARSSSRPGGLMATAPRRACIYSAQEFRGVARAGPSAMHQAVRPTFTPAVSAHPDIHTRCLHTHSSFITAPGLSAAQ